jgi:hypothetical protein
MFPIDTEFNAVVLHMVRLHVPHGYTLTSESMDSFEQMKRMFEESGLVTVNTDHSDGTIFGSASVNWAFRAWHDSCHLVLGADFTPEGERRAAELQSEQLKRAYPLHPKLQYWLDLIDIEVNGQLNYLLTTGNFPDNQLQFALDQLKKRGY